MSNRYPRIREFTLLNRVLFGKFNRVNSRYTTAAFTISPEPRASLYCADLPGDLALYAISVRQLIALHSGFLQTVSHDSALAFG
jgi:hypothetical protein